MAKQVIPSQEKHKQHRIPRSYLRGFVPNQKKSEIWVYKEGKQWNPGIHSEAYNPCLAGFNKTAWEEDAYAFVTRAGQTDFNAVEDWLHRKEEEAKPILAKLRARQSISSPEKETFAQYIQVMLRRTAERDRRMRTVADKVVANSLLHWPSLEFAKRGDFTRSRMISEIEEYSGTVVGKKWLLELSRVGMIPQLHADLVGLKWTFFAAPAGAFFVTSNYPVIYNQIPNRYSMLIFPISSNVVLLQKSNAPSDLQFVNASSDEVIAINFAFIREASVSVPCEIYASRADKKVLEMLTNGIDLNDNQKNALLKLYV